MARKIIFPIIIFFTLIAAANVRSAPLLVVAYGEIIFAALMIAFSLFQKSRLRATPVHKFLSIKKDHPCDCNIRVENFSPLPIGRFCLELTHGYNEANEAHVVLYGGTDKHEGYLKVTLENEHCGINHLKLKRIKCYDLLLLSSFSKKLDNTMQVAVFPDDSLKLRIISASHNVFSKYISGDNNLLSSHKGGNEPDDIRSYREGDPLRSIYWKQSAKMNELWVKEFREDVQTLPVIQILVADILDMELTHADAFYRIFYALMAGMFEISDSFILRCINNKKGYIDYLISDIGHLKMILICFYKYDFKALDEIYTEYEFSPVTLLKLDPHNLTLYIWDKIIKRFTPDIIDKELCNTTLFI